MLERRYVAPTSHYGQGYLNGSCKRGCFVKINGVFTADAGPTGSAGKPGYASSGDIKVDLTGSGDGLNPEVQIGIVDKLFFSREDSELTKDTLESGAGVIVYQDGIFTTDQYVGNPAGWTVGSQMLYISGSAGLISTGLGLSAGDAVNSFPRAQYLGYVSSYDSNYWNRAPITIKLLPYGAIS